VKIIHRFQSYTESQREDTETHREIKESALYLGLISLLLYVERKEV
jgi:hypothetical protein